MVTIANLVEKIIEQKPFMQEALSKGLVNNAALAEQMIPEIEKELKKKVKFSAVNMAIRRLSEKLEKTFIAQVKFDKFSHITVRSDIIEITVYKTENLQKKLQSIYDLIDYKKGDFLAITQGVNEVMLIMDSKYKEQLLKLFSKKEIKKIIEDLSSVTINIPQESIETVGLFYIITRALNWENINIVEIISTLTEMTFIIKEEDTPKAFSTLKNLIKTNS
ncbi:hypothetical protein HOK51_09680 [Candidatus Woesearchaeota archaeon]|jgi:aspartokinase|nr:hypothetical protein [Candidatus Woesearchaeota archaeon]MBT6520093.1 hypothetical protein [Candidatus Woesearchaeota archaeon]MBT7366698.1 hypothetical protein [Candidatus Woesearchaeota archaeon]